MTRIYTKHDPRCRFKVVPVTDACRDSRNRILYGEWMRQLMQMAPPPQSQAGRSSHQEQQQQEGWVGQEEYSPPDETQLVQVVQAAQAAAPRPVASASTGNDSVSIDHKSSPVVCRMNAVRLLARSR